MKTRKKILTLAILPIIGIGYVEYTQANIRAMNVPGTTILYGQNTAFYFSETTDNITEFIDVAYKLIVEETATINLYGMHSTTGIFAINGSSLILGSGSTINSENIDGSHVGLHIEDQSTIMTAEDLTLNVKGERGSVCALELDNKAEVQLTGNTTISPTITEGGVTTGISLKNESSLVIDTLNLTVDNLTGNGINVYEGSKLTLGDGSSISVKNDNAIYATGSGSEVNLNKTTIDTQNAYAINAQYNAIVNLGTGTTINSNNTNAVGVWAVDNAQLIADNLTVNHAGGHEAIQATEGGIIKIGPNSHVTSSAGGIAALNDSSINFEGTADKRNSITTYNRWGVTAQNSGAQINIKNTDIVADNTGNGTIVGLFSYNQGVINAENTNISVDDNGLPVYALNGGVIKLSEKTAIYAGTNNKSALVTSGINSKIYVTGQALINGNIFASGSGSLIDIDATDSSFINGYTTIDTENSGATVNIKMTDSAWNVTDDSQVNSLTVNNSTINFAKDEFETLTADSLNGTNGLFDMRTDIVEQQGDLIVINGTARGNYKLNITNNGTETTDGSETLTVVKTNDNQANFTLSNKVELGAYEYGLRSVKDSVHDLELYSLDKKKTSSAEAAGSFLTIGYLSNYVENQTLLQRLGDLRNGQIMNTQNDGFWIKGFGGRLNSFAGNGLSGFDANYIGTMLGADKGIDVENGDLFVGGMIGFTRINPDYRQGNGNGKNYSASLYATYLLDNGLYFDGILKYNTLKNRFNVRDTAGQAVKGNSKTNGISLSAELGKRFWLSENNQGRYIEPQMQLTYGYQGGDTVHSSNGLKVQLSHYNSMLLRVGSLLGYQVEGDNPANFYVKVGIIRELDSDADYRFNNGEKHNYNFKSGWFNSGIGANINVNKQHSFYTEADFSTGHSFNNLTFNAGYRFNF